MFAMSFYFSASSFYFSFFSYHIWSDQELFYSIFSFYWLWSYTLIFYSFDDWAVTLKITKCIANSPRSNISFYLCMLWSKLTQDLRTEHHLPHSFLCAAFFLIHLDEFFTMWEITNNALWSQCYFRFQHICHFHCSSLFPASLTFHLALFSLT